MEDARKMARIFKVLSVDTRVRILQLLKGRALCVNALASKLEITAAAVSQHLRILRDTELVRAEKRGNFVHYCLNEDTLIRWKELAESLLDSNVK